MKTTINHIPHILYFGRLSEEKGRNDIIGMLNYFIYHYKNKLPFVVHICGSGSFIKKIHTIKKQIPDYLHYYGFCSIAHIQQIAQQCQYCLMPSIFVETFGLSALQALSWGLPVIAYKKGGLVPFILDTYDLSKLSGSSTDRLIQMMYRIVQEKNPSIKTVQWCHTTANKYSTQAWLDRLQKLLDTPRYNKKLRIVLITDFLPLIGGIEIYVQNIVNLLRKEGYEIHLFGSYWGSTRFSRLLSMVLALFNIPFAIHLYVQIYRIQPDVIRCHSVLRYVGWLSLRVITLFKAKKWMMFHDMGYFQPFPHKLQDVEDIFLPWFTKKYMSSIPRTILLPFVGVKWCMIHIIHFFLRRFDVLLVPSEFMKPIVQRVYPNKKVVVLPHFIVSST